MRHGHLRQNWSTLLRPGQLEGGDPSWLARFVCEPLERGFGDELGALLRHTLLHSVRGVAVVGVRARLDDGLPPVVWMNELRLNLSQLAIVDCGAPQSASLEVRAEAVVLASALSSVGLHVVDPSQQLCVARRPLALDLWIERGCGMRLGSLRAHSLPAGVAAVDAFFGPVRRADYFTERPLVGAWASCDRLTVDIETNGAMTPHEALWAAVRVLTSHPGRRLDFAA
jgi:DNA-directed RNA polymerase subunit alpha